MVIYSILKEYVLANIRQTKLINYTSFVQFHFALSTGFSVEVLMDHF